MARFLRANFAIGVLATGLSGSNLQLTMRSGHTLPKSSGLMRLMIWDMDLYSNPADDPHAEIVTASYSGSGEVYNIIRGEEGTSAYEHAAGSAVALHYTAGVSEADLNVVGTKEVDEANIGNNKVLTYDASVNKLRYKYVHDGLADGLVYIKNGALASAPFDTVLGCYLVV